MTMKKSLFPGVLLCLLLNAGLHAQNRPEKLPVRFGRVTPEDFNVPTPTGPDSSAGAIVIADYGLSTFEGNVKGWFDLTFKHSCRIKILKHSGFEAATISIPLYTSANTTEKLQSLHAVTYNLEGGKVVETKLDDKSIFTDKISKYYINKKFTFPALKEGSIIEYTYTQTSPFIFNLQPWDFQGEYPCLWSEYQAEMPNFFQYATLGQGFHPFTVNSTDERQVTFHMTDPGITTRDERYTFEDKVVTHRWVMKDVPALREEPFTTTTRNYISRVEFQLSRYQFPNMMTKDMMGNWYTMTSEILKAEDFGADLNRNNGWLDDSLKVLLKDTKTPLEKSQRIYAFVRDKFTCTSHGDLSLSAPLKTIFKNRNGNEADLNLLLTAMLHHEKINADPVILSTRSHGFVNSMYPLLSRYNYVITRMTIDSSEYYLDASEPWMAFGKLPQRCYNGYARILSLDNPQATVLTADNVNERKMTVIFITREETGKGLIGHVQSMPGFNETCGIREKVKEKGQQEFARGIQSAYTGEMSFSNLALDSVKIPDQPLAVNYDLRISPDSLSDVFYFNPMLAEGYKENPFKAAERKYPVEMGGTMDESVILTMEVPEGYVVDEVPKSVKVSYNDDEGSFEYLVVKNNDNIQFRSRIQLKKANYKPEDYNSLREFFGFIVKKESEQIVFKKKKA